METLLLIKDFLSKKFTISTWQLLLGIIIGIILFFSLKGCGQSKTQLPTPQMKPTVRYKDSKGDNHAVIAVTTGSQDNYKAQFDSLKKVINDKNIRIKELSKFTVTVDTYFTQVPVYIDTVKKQISIEKKDNYIDISAVVDMKTGMSDIGLQSVDTLTYARYSKRKLFRPLQERIDISNKNPYNRIEQGYSIDITQRTPIIVFGPSVNLGYSFQGKITPTLGISATLNLLSIKSRK